MDENGLALKPNHIAGKLSPRLLIRWFSQVLVNTEVDQKRTAGLLVKERSSRLSVPAAPNARHRKSSPIILAWFVSLAKAPLDFDI
jgi:hypothetical protein